MKRTLLISIVCFTANYLFAQAIQNGVVKEYNERLEKTPLTNVEVTISNAASTVSDKNGNFQLQFRTLKPGDKVNVRRIEKLGYEIFNKEALEQWFISRENRLFTIIMCKSDRFKRIRDNYSRVSSASYEKQLKKEEARLDAERKAGKLKEAEYETTLKKLNDEYDRQLENLDNYVDRFARIDLSELSVVEAEIIELVQSGNIDEAIRRYEQQNLEEKYKKQVDDGRKAQAAIEAFTVVKTNSQTSRDSLFASILRKNEMLKLAGGRENFEKIGNSLREIASSDTTYYNAVWEFALYCIDMNIYDDAESYLKKALLLSKDSIKISEAYNRLGSIFENTNRGDEAEWCFKTALSYINVIDNKREVATIYNNLGVLFSHLRQFEKAENHLNKSLSLREELLDIERTETVYELSCSYNNFGMLYSEMQQLETAEAFYKKSLPLDTILEKRGNSAQRSHLGTTLNNLATTYHRLAIFSEAERYYLAAIEKRNEYVKYNPGRYIQDLIGSETNLAALYMEQNKHKESQSLAEDAVIRMEPIYKMFPTAYRRIAISCYNTLANILNLQKEYATAVIYYQKAIENAEKLPPSNYAEYVTGVILGNYGAVQMYQHNYVESESAYKQSMNYFEKLNDSSNKAYLPDIARQQFNLGALYRLFLNNQDQAEHYLKLSVENYQELNRLHPNAYDMQLTQSLAGLSQLYSKLKRFGEASNLLVLASAISPELRDVLDAQGVLSYLTGDIDKAKEIWEKKRRIDPEEAHVNSWLYDLLFNEGKGVYGTE